MTSASSSIDLASDSDDEIQIVTMWDREARKEDMYKIVVPGHGDLDIYIVGFHRRVKVPSVRSILYSTT